MSFITELLNFSQLYSNSRSYCGYVVYGVLDVLDLMEKDIIRIQVRQFYYFCLGCFGCQREICTLIAYNNYF